MPIGDGGGQPRMYCAFCRTGYENTAAEAMRASGLCVAMPVRKTKRENRRGKWVTFDATVLPGYLFLYAEEALWPSDVARIAGVYRLLDYADGSRELRGADRQFAQWLLEHNGVIGLSTAVREGDRVMMLEGPLKEFSGRIMRVDKRKCIAKVAVNVASSEQYIWLSFDWLRAE